MQAPEMINSVEDAPLGVPDQKLNSEPIKK
jgi:hypothetical protein